MGEFSAACMLMVEYNKLKLSGPVAKRSLWDSICDFKLRSPLDEYSLWDYICDFKSGALWMNTRSGTRSAILNPEPFG